MTKIQDVDFKEVLPEVQPEAYESVDIQSQILDTIKNRLAVYSKAVVEVLAASRVGGQKDEKEYVNVYKELMVQALHSHRTVEDQVERDIERKLSYQANQALVAGKSEVK